MICAFYMSVSSKNSSATRMKPLRTDCGISFVALPVRCGQHKSPPCCVCERPADVVVIGGGAAGFFAAIACARRAGELANVQILEATPRVLQKVRISGGGRCNVTSGLAHDDARSFASNYPRGHRALVGVLTRYGAPEVVEFFEREGVILKTESTGKMFPVTDSSETVVGALVGAAHRSNVRVTCGARAMALQRVSREYIVRTTKNAFKADYVVLTTGSARAPLEWSKQLGHDIVPQVPSLFSFVVDNRLLDGLAGIAVPDCTVSLRLPKKLLKRESRGTVDQLTQRGAVLITHWGVSGPAVLTISAYGARLIHQLQYKVDCVVDWAPQLSVERTIELFREARKLYPHRSLRAFNPLRGVNIPRRLWRALVECVGNFTTDMRWNSVNNSALEQLAQIIHETVLPVTGRGEFKDEFVTAGGVSLSDVDVKTFESKRAAGLYYAGEVLDVDGSMYIFTLLGARFAGTHDSNHSFPMLRERQRQRQR